MKVNIQFVNVESFKLELISPSGIREQLLAGVKQAMKVCSSLFSNCIVVTRLMRVEQRPGVIHDIKGTLVLLEFLW